MLNDGLRMSVEESKAAAGFMEKTVSGAFTRVGNEFEAMWGEFNKGSGITAAVAAGVIFFADNLEFVLVPAATIAAATVGLVFATAAKALASLTATLVASPIGLIVTGITLAAAGGMYLFGNSMKQTAVDANDLERRIASLRGEMSSMTETARKAAIVKYSDELGDFKREYERLKKERDYLKRDELNMKYKGASNSSIKVVSDEIAKIDGQLETLGGSINNLEGFISDLGKESTRAFSSMEESIRFVGKALSIYEDMNKQLFMFNNTNSDAELSYQRQFGYLKDISDIQYETLRLKQGEVTTAKLLADNEKDLTSILTSVKEQYDNIGKSVKEITIARAIDKGATKEQLDDLNMMLTAIGNAGGGSGSGGGLNYFGDKLKSINDELYKMQSLNQDILAFGDPSKYTAVKDLTLELNNQNSVLSQISEKQRGILLLQAQELDSQKQINEILMIDRDYTKTFEDMYFEISLMGQTQKAIEKLTFARDLERRVKEISIGMSEENIAKLREETMGILAQRDAIEALRLAKENDPFGGMRDGFDSYVNSMGTVRDQFSSVTESMFGGLTDAISSFASGADQSFSDMTRSVLQNISKMLVQMAILNAMKAIFGGGFGFGDGGFLSAIRGGTFASGGYTGAGGVYEPAGIVHKGEVVFSQRDVSRFGGVSAVESMRLRGYAGGGVVGGNAYKISQQSQQQPIILNVTVYEDGSVEVDQKGITGDIKKYIDVTVDRKIANNKRPGGMLG